MRASAEGFDQKANVLIAVQNISGLEQDTCRRESSGGIALWVSGRNRIPDSGCISGSPIGTDWPMR